MPQCAVANCYNTHRKTKGDAVRYHRFPSDAATRSRWLHVCGRYVQNCATARVCSKHFSPESYERDVQHELLGLPTRCRLKKGAVPDINIPATAAVAGDESSINAGAGGGIAVLLAVGLVPAAKARQTTDDDLIKRHAMEAVQEGSDVSEVQDSSINQENQESNDQLTANAEEAESGKFSKEEPVEEEQKLESENSENVSSEEKETKDYQDDVLENGGCTSEEALIERVNDEDKLNLDYRRDSSCTTPTNSKVGKRKKEDEESPIKKLRSEVQQSFTIRNKIFSELMESSACKTVDQIQARIERIILEIRTLNEVALEKEREWNSIIHLRKLKEELLLRMQRKKQVMLYNSRDLSECDKIDSYSDLNQSVCNSQQQQSCFKQVSNPNVQDKSEVEKQLYNKQQSSLGMLNNFVDMNGHSNESKTFNKQRNVVDVQSIIADYRQRHPETVPRRGRRIRSSLNSQNDNNQRIAQSGTINFSSVALGSGSQVKHNISNNKLDTMNSELGMFFNTMENSKQNGSKLGPSDVQGNLEEPSFKDVLMQFAKLSQNERCELIQNALKPPPPYPEVTVHPVPVTTQQQKNSLLHGILTQAQPKAESKTTFSPTLARLLTAPERSVASSLGTVPTTNSLLNSGNVSINDILSNNKARHEITITPVGGQYEVNNKPKTGNQDEDEAEDSADRLVIDESEGDRGHADNSSDAGDEVPQCQGCNQQPAQFVCAGCGNQWYCSRKCQVSAWDEHSEVCSG